MFRLLIDEHRVGTAVIFKVPLMISSSKRLQREKLTLVTFDLGTIPPLLRLWGEEGTDHGGVVLVDERTIAQDDIGN